MKRIALACALVGLGTFSQPTLANADSDQFETRYSEGEAAVRPKRDYPDSVIQQACQRALTSPIRSEVRERLEEKLSLTFTRNVGFSDASINNYRSWEKDKWVHCSGTVKVTDWPLNLAGLAIRLAWHYAGKNQPDYLRPLLKVALEHPDTTADAVALIAHLAPKDQQQSYLGTNLEPEKLTMPAAIESVANIWFEQGQWADVIRLTKRCDTLACRRLRLDAEEQKEMEDAEKVDDLSSYF